MSVKIAIIGAGMAGLACATKLSGSAADVHLFDKGRGASGRMASRTSSSRLGETTFDMGAQYFTAHSADFAAQVSIWHQFGLVAPWAAAGDGAYVGVPTMNAPLKHMAEKLPVTWSAKIDSLQRSAGQWTLRGEAFEAAGFDLVLVAIPAEQSAQLLQNHAPDLAGLARKVPSEPCWTLMVSFSAPLSLPEDVVRDCGPISWAARNSAKPGRSGPESWVIHATPEWSKQHLEDDKDSVCNDILGEFSRALNISLPEVAGVAAHRWRFARSGKAGVSHLWNAGQGLGVCGDWLLGPRVECAWTSGNTLAQAVKPYLDTAGTGA